MTALTSRPAQVQFLLDKVRQSLSPHRQHHVLGVAHTVTMLAARHGLPVERAMLAGLLHDVYKETPPDRIQALVARLGGAIPPEDLPFPSLWHGYCAGLMAQRELGLDEQELFEAVMLHTTADANVGALTRALFVADFAEPGRKPKSAPRVLEAACRDLDAGFREALRAKTEHMQGQRKRLSPRAIRALLHYLPPELAVDLVTADAVG